MEEKVVYLEGNQLTPEIYTPIEETVSLDSAFTSMLIKQFTPLLMQNLNNMLDEKFSYLYQYLESRFDNINNEISNSNRAIEVEEPNIVLIEEITREQAKKQIIDFFENYDGEIYPSELSEQLHISYEIVWEILKELHEENLIKTGD
jgi:hypothetical protein